MNEKTLSLSKIPGKISPATTSSASSTECFAICAKQEITCLFNFASLLLINGARYTIVLASTTA